jgi:hypothetical protein
MSHQLPEDPDRRLVEFLRQNAPVAPSAPPQLETDLIHQLEDTPQSVPQQGWHWQNWLLPGAIAAGLFLGISGQRLLTPQPQLATTPEDIEALEAFLLDNWGSTIGVTPEIAATSSLTNNWLLLADPQASSLVYSQ